ncbi:MAG: SDR family oxidoreductase, partial [Planctomycetota bacterium]
MWRKLIDVLEHASQRVVLITGADGGIGAGLVRRFTDDGWRVAAHGVSNDSDFVADFRDVDAVAALVPAVLGRFGRVDTLINNAAIDPGRQEPTGQQLADLIAVNLLAPMRLASGCVASWRRSGTSAGGRIVNISSIQARHSRAGRGGYVAAKGGLEAWTRQLAVELGPLGVTVNAVAPGFVDVPRT